MKNRILSWLMTIAMVVSLFPTSVALAADVSDATEVTFVGDECTLGDNGIYKVTGDQTGKTIKITNSAQVTLLLDGATLSAATSPIQVENGATLTLVVADDSANTVTCTATAADDTNNGMTAGISVPEGATLNIDTPEGGSGNGTLNVVGGNGGADIGGGRGNDGTVGSTGGYGGKGENGRYDNLSMYLGGAGGKGGDGGKGGNGGAGSYIDNIRRL